MAECCMCVLTEFTLADVVDSGQMPLFKVLCNRLGVELAERAVLVNGVAQLFLQSSSELDFLLYVSSLIWFVAFKFLTRSHNQLAGRRIIQGLRG